MLNILFNVFLQVGLLLNCLGLVAVLKSRQHKDFWHRLMLSMTLVGTLSLAVALVLWMCMLFGAGR